MSDSDGDESVPPDVQHGDAVPADHAPATDAGGDGAATATHPVWAAAAAGRGGGGGAPKGGSGSLFAPISMMELELRGRGDFDGASSAASVRGKEKQRKKKPKSPPRDYDDDDDDEEASVAGSEPDIANAAFGGKRKAAPHACGSEVSDDALSVASADKRAAHSRAFPVSGVHCVGCALPAKIAPVNEFIQKNMASMSELALFKMAAMVYINKVAEPAEEEGVSVPPWHWKDIRAHFTLHAVDPRMQRFENVRTLASMRKTLELQLLRRDADSGEQCLDKSHAEQILKVITASSRELTLLHEGFATRKK